MKSKLSPRTPSPTTPIPITAPPPKATSRALAKPVLAALVVLTLALVATFIPMNPAKAEQIAPRMKDKATIGAEPSVTEPPQAIKTATTTTKMESTLYSAFKKAIAPSAMFSAIRAILSVPISCFPTHPDLMKVKIKATSPNAGKA